MKNKSKAQTVKSALTWMALSAVLSATASAQFIIQAAPGANGDTTADAVLGQLDFRHNVRNFLDQRGLSTSGSFFSDVAIDRSVVPNRAFAVDRDNHRVLGWTNVAAFATNAPANIVIGQPDALSSVCNNGGITERSLCSPSGAAVDGGGNLYIADQSNHRILEYNTPFSKGLIANIPADEVFGQFGSFNSQSCNGFGLNSSALCNPARVAVDSARNLYVSDASNHRVLGYRTPLTVSATVGSGDTSADLVFGQAGVFTTQTCNNGGVSANSICNPQGLAVDGAANLYVGDFSNNRVLLFNTPLTTNTTADKVFGQNNNFAANLCNSPAVNQNTLCGPTGVATDGPGNLYITDRSNHRALAYLIPVTTNTTADRAFGQFFSFISNICNNTFGGLNPPVNSRNLCNPSGVAADSSNNVYIADSNNNRVLKFNTPLPVAGNDVTADGAVGQNLLTTGNQNLVDGLGFDFTGEGGVAIDRSVLPNRVYVADTQNNRVLGWNAIAAFVSHAPANLVFGQPTLFNNAVNNGGITATSLSLSHPRSVAVDSAGTLYVADQNNHRVLAYLNPFGTNTVADRVFGQGGAFTTNGCNQGGLVNANSLCTPVAVAVDSANNLYVGDFSNNRVLEFNAPTINTTADRVFGQGNSFTSNTCNLGGVSATSLCGPHGIATDANANVFIADHNNHRVLEYNTPLPVTANRTADRVFGQAGGFVSNTCNLGGVVSADSLCSPRYLVVTGNNNLFVTDVGNDRVLKFNNPNGTNTTADRVIGQGNQLTLNGCKPLSHSTVCRPDGISRDSVNNVYIADANNNRVLKFNLP